MLPLQSEESAQITFRRNTKYNINVRAIRSDDHQVQSDWASLRVDTKDFGECKFFLLTPYDRVEPCRMGFVAVENS